MHWETKDIRRALFLALLATQTAYANSGNWNLTSGGDWDNSANWAYPNGGAAAFPNGIDEVASFSTVPTGVASITSSTNITIGTLVSAPLSVLTMNFDQGNTLSFNTSTGMPGEVVVASGDFIFLYPIDVLTPSGLSVTGGSNANSITLSEISNAGDLFLSGQGSTQFYLQGNSPSNGMTEVRSAILSLNSLANNTVISCKGLKMHPETQINVLGGTDIFHHDCTVELDQAVFTLNGSPFSVFEVIGHLVCSGGEVKENGIATSLEITNTQVPACTPITQPIIIGGNGLIHISNLLLSGPGSITYNPTIPGHGTFTGSGTFNGIMSINLGTNNMILDVSSGGNTDYDINFSDVTFNNGTLEKDNLGIVLFEGTSGSIPQLTIQNGTVSIGRNGGSDIVGTTGDTLLPSSSVLNGFGTLGLGTAHVINNQGTLNPGNPYSIGSLTINGRYTQGAGGTLLIKGLNSGQTDKLVVQTGGVSLNGTLAFQALQGSNFSEGDQLVIIDNTGGTGISGTFSSIQANLPSCLTTQVQYNSNQVLLLFSLCNLPPVPFRSVADHYINLAIPIFNLAQGRMIELSRRLEYVRSRFSSPKSHKNELAFLASADAEGGFLLTAPKKSEPETDETPQTISVSRFRKSKYQKPLSFYAAPLGSLGTVNGISSQRGFSFHSLGGVIGADYAFSRIGTGISLSYEQLHAHVDHNWGHFSFQTVLGNLYTTFLPLKNRHFFVDAALDIGHNLYHIHRNTSQKTVLGKPNGWQGNGFIGIGYDFASTHWRITPLASMQWSYVNISHYKEDGAPSISARVEDQSIRSTRSSLGASAGGTWNCDHVTWMPEMRAAWQHEFTSQEHRLSISSVSTNTTFQAPIFGEKRNYATGGASLRALFGSHFSALGSYDYYWNSDSHTQFFYLELSAAF